MGGPNYDKNNNTSSSSSSSLPKLVLQSLKKLGDMALEPNQWLRMQQDNPQIINKHE
jgi:hypothetical protein